MTPAKPHSAQISRSRDVPAGDTRLNGIGSCGSIPVTRSHWIALDQETKTGSPTRMAPASVMCPPIAMHNELVFPLRDALEKRVRSNSSEATRNRCR